MLGARKPIHDLRKCIYSAPAAPNGPYLLRSYFPFKITGRICAAGP